MKYHAIAERDGRFWLVTIPQIDQVTQALNLREVEPMARDLIAVMTEVEPTSFDVEISVKLPEQVQELWELSEELHEAAAELQREAKFARGLAARALRGLGLPMRDIGQALGVSHQRADQLLGTAEELLRNCPDTPRDSRRGVDSVFPMGHRVLGDRFHLDSVPCSALFTLARDEKGTVARRGESESSSRNSA